MSTKSTESWSTATASAAWVPLFTMFYYTLFYLCCAISPSPRSPFNSPLSLFFTNLRYFSFSLCMCVCLYRFIISERRTATMWWWWTSWGPLSKTYSTSALGSSHWKQVSDWFLYPPWYLGAGRGGVETSYQPHCSVTHLLTLWCLLQYNAMRRFYVWCRGMFVLYTITHMTVLTLTHITVRTPHFSFTNSRPAFRKSWHASHAPPHTQRHQTGEHTRGLHYTVLSCPVLSCPVLSCPVLSCPSLRLHYLLFIYSHLPSPSHVASLHLHFSLSTPSLLFPLIFFPPYILLPLMSLWSLSPIPFTPIPLFWPLSLSLSSLNLLSSLLLLTSPLIPLVFGCPWLSVQLFTAGKLCDRHRGLRR